MNTKIARILFDAHRQNPAENALKPVAKTITEVHNSAVKYGFLELPLLECLNVESNSNGVTVMVRPLSGMARLNDIYLIQSAWGADTTDICSAFNGMAICLNFNKD